MNKIGVIGCGLMGSGIVKNLLKHDYEVNIFDINKNATVELEKMGASVFDSTQHLAETVDYLILSLPSPKMIRNIMIEPEAGALHVMKKNSFVLDMSTNDVEVTKELHEKAKVNHINFFDCPLSGGPTGAETGTLTIMVGGNEEAFPSIFPVLQAIGENIEYVGPSGTGQCVKLCNNMLVAGIITLISEAFLTAEGAGVSKEKLASILQKGSAQTRVMEVFGGNILNHSFSDVNFSLMNMNKDVNLYRNLAEDRKTPTIASQSIHQIFQIANNRGQGKKDSTSVYELIADL